MIGGNSPLENLQCSIMGGEESSTNLSPALQTLKNEHIPLRKQMEELKAFSDFIGKDEEVSDWVEHISNLREKVKQFMEQLEPHSEREEGALFPLMAKYIGKESGPIAVMEYEHEMAKKYLRTFKEETSQLSKPLKKEEATVMANHVVQAYLILTEHFMKEENVLFPMAEKLLSKEEKEELAIARRTGN
jgi:regulator of cell morphogenesis and NO signaling